MRKLTVAIGVAILATTFPIANAQEDLDYRLGGTWYSVQAEQQRFAAAPERMAGPRLPMAAPYEETLFDRSWPALPEQRAATDEASFGATAAPVSPFDRDYGFIAPAQ